MKYNLNTYYLFIYLHTLLIYITVWMLKIYKKKFYFTVEKAKCLNRGIKILNSSKKDKKHFSKIF